MSPSESTSLRALLPLSLFTCAGMLAVDLYLPALPTLQADLATTVPHAQATVALYFVGLALSQLLWGEAMTRFGPKRCVAIAGVGMLLTALGCALAPDIDALLAVRLAEGLFAGAATVVAPSVVKAMLSDHQAVRGIAAIGMIESLVPALGPVLGALLLGLTDWRGLFFVVAAVSALALPLAWRATPHRLPGFDARVPSGYGRILSQPRFTRVALSHALSFGALLCFVASAPQLLHTLQLGPSVFAALQVAGVLSFMAAASQAGRTSARLGAARTIQLGAVLQAFLCLSLLSMSFVGLLHVAGVFVFWMLFCAGLGLRGPVSFSEALDLPPSQMGRASALITLGMLATGAIATQAVAPGLREAGSAMLPAWMAGLCVLSCALVWPYPARAPAASS